MYVVPSDMSSFACRAAFVVFFAFLWLLVVVLVYHLAVTEAKAQDGRPKKRQCRGNKGNARAFVLLEASQPSRTHCPVHPEMDVVYEIVHQFNNTIEDLKRYLDTLSLETSEDSDSSWTSITATEVRSSSRVSLSSVREAHTSTMTSNASSSAEVSVSPSGEDPLNLVMTSKASSTAEMSQSPPREEPNACITNSEASSSADVSLCPSREHPPNSIMSSEASSSAEVSVSPSSDNSTCIIVSNIGSSSWASLPTLEDGEDLAHASSIQPGLGHPRADPEEQPGPATPPPCEEEVASCLEAGSMQQHQQDDDIQLGAPTPPPEVLDIHPGEMEMPLHYNKGQDTLEGLIPESKLEQELGLPADVDETPQDVPASAPPSPQRPQERDVMVVPMVQDLPFLDEAVKRELEHHIAKMKIQRRYGLHMRILECEQSFENLILR